MNLSKITLFLSGLFFGGSMDHLFLVLKRSEFTPYGVHSGVKGNALLATLDAGLALLLLLLHYRLEKKTASVVSKSC